MYSPESHNSLHGNFNIRDFSHGSTRSVRHYRVLINGDLAKRREVKSGTSTTPRACYGLRRDDVYSHSEVGRVPFALLDNARLTLSNRSRSRMECGAVEPADY